MNATRTCSIDGCDREHEARGMCHTHYMKWKRNHKGTIPPSPRSNPEIRFWSKVDKSGDCWIWLGTKSKRGYGAFRVEGRAVRAHRYAWESVNGRLADGAEIDHQCRVTSCVNPAHLKPVTRSENQQNIGMLKSNTSGYKGVYWKKQNRRWGAQVAHEGTKMHLGYFDTAEDADQVAREKRNELFTNNILERSGEMD